MPPRRRPRLALALAATAAFAAAAGPMRAAAQSDSKPTGAIYSCIDDHGRRLTSDRPIVECIAKEQQVLNRDGSLKAIQPPTLTADERAAKEARDRAAALARAAQADAVRRDRNLLARYPDEEAHDRARQAALDTVRVAMKATAERLRELAAERKPLRDEAEFYVGKPLPMKLRAAIDANDAAVDAQREAAATQQAELDRINHLYDAELAHLRKLWAGATPGSLGTVGGTGTAGAAGPRATQVGR
ncbi:MAG: hypothetical protein KGJ24_03155 [Burkholderiales bacterium]|nr:hypothetical protein [Burkholderiales bacterium]